MTSLNQFKKVIILSPHTDDGEFGCGATIAKLLQQKSEVHYIAFSSADESVPENFSSDILRREVFRATSVLGIHQNNVNVLNFPVRRFNDFRQDILEYLVKISRDMQPDLVFMPSTYDCHQDHVVITQEAIRAFKNKTILGYEIIWNNFKFDNQCFVHISQEQLSLKINAVSCYESQKHRHYAQDDLIRSLARVRGAQVAGNYAELFEVIRWVVY